MNKNKKSIKLLFIYIMGFILFLNLFFSLMAFLMILKNFKNYAQSRNQVLLNSVSIILQNYYDEKNFILANISDVISENIRVKNMELVRAALDSSVRNYPFFDGIMILDENGNVIEASELFQSSLRFNYRTNDFFIQPFYTKKHFWSSSFISNETGLRTLTIGYPGENFVLVAYINLIVLQEKISDIKYGSKLTVNILDKNGVYIATDKDNYAEEYKVDFDILDRLKIERSGSYERAVNNVPEIVNYKFLDSIDWTVLISQNKSELFDFVYRMSFAQISFFLILLVIIIIFSNYIVIRMSKVFGNFIESMDKVSSGNYNEVIQLTEFEEIDGLSVYFNRMQKAIKLREESIKYNELKLRVLVENIPVGIGINSLDGNINYINNKFTDIFGYKLDEMPTIEKWSELAYPDIELRNKYSAIWKNDIENAVENGSNKCGGKIYKITAKSGIVKDVELSFSIFNNEVYSVFNDLTNILLMGRELETVKNYLDKVINSMPSMIIGVNSNLEIVIINNYNFSYIDFNKSDKKEELSKLSEFYEGLEEKLKISISSNEIITIPDYKITADNTVYYHEILIYPIENEGAVIRIDDVTERIRFQEIMVQTEKMATIGELAAGMAHEINNPLASIIQSGQNTLRRLSLEFDKNIEAAAEVGVNLELVVEYLKKRNILTYIEGINSSGKKAAYIVSNMLNFSRKTNQIKEKENINEIIEESITLALTDYDLGKKYDLKHMTINRNYDEELPYVSLKKTEIEQVILNLIKNAAHSMGEKLKTAKSYKPELDVYTGTEADSVYFKIRDNGTGISDSMRKKIFEPFYTTKPVGIGTGLGLTVSYFIITENHGGKIFVDSKEGEWTEFLIYIPLDKT